MKKKIGFIGNDIVLKDELKRNFDIQETGEKIVVSELGIKELAEISQYILVKKVKNFYIICLKEKS